MKKIFHTDVGVSHIYKKEQSIVRDNLDKEMRQSFHIAMLKETSQAE